MNTEMISSVLPGGKFIRFDQSANTYSLFDEDDNLLKTSKDWESFESEFTSGEWDEVLSKPLRYTQEGIAPSQAVEVSATEKPPVGPNDYSDSDLRIMLQEVQEFIEQLQSRYGSLVEISGETKTGLMKVWVNTVPIIIKVGR